VQRNVTLGDVEFDAFAEPVCCNLYLAVVPGRVPTAAATAATAAAAAAAFSSSARLHFGAAVASVNAAFRG
jgi:hypothetical protein